MRLYHIKKTQRGGSISLSRTHRGLQVHGTQHKIGGYSPLLLSKNLGGFGLSKQNVEETKPIINNISRKLESLKVNQNARKNVKFLL